VSFALLDLLYSLLRCIYYGELIVEFNLECEDDMSETKWVQFWFDGNQAWGLIDSPEEWERVKEAYPTTDLRKAKRASNNYETNGTPYFGFRMECILPETLGEWADANGMKI